MLSPGLSRKTSYFDNITTAETSAMVIDTLGFDYCVIDWYLGTAAATTVAGVLNVQEGDTTASYSTVAALTGGTATSSTVGFVIPAHTGTTTTAKEVYATFNIDLRPRKRYLKVVCTPGSDANITGIANLYRADEMPTAAGTATNATNAMVVVAA